LPYQGISFFKTWSQRQHSVAVQYSSTIIAYSTDKDMGKNMHIRSEYFRGIPKIKAKLLLIDKRAFAYSIGYKSRPLPISEVRGVK
jgi:hypothetical protein